MLCFSFPWDLRLQSSIRISIKKMVLPFMAWRICDTMNKGSLLATLHSNLNRINVRPFYWLILSPHQTFLPLPFVVVFFSSTAISRFHPPLTAAILTGYGVCKMQTNPVHLPNPPAMPNVRPTLFSLPSSLLQIPFRSFPFFCLKWRLFERERNEMQSKF